MADTPIIAPTSAARGFLPPGPGLYRFQFGIAGQGFGQGYLNGPFPMEGQDLDNFLQQYVAGITGLDPTMVRPRWQAEPPDLPDFGTDWASIGIIETHPDPGFANIEHDDANDGRDYVSEHETLVLLCSFYGPHSEWYDRLLRTGLYVPQNHEIMQLMAMGLVDTGPRTAAPALIKGRWTRKSDRRIRFHRQVRLVYPVLNILSASFNAVVESAGGGEFYERSKTVPAP